jgi:hypothetical protein
MKMDLFREWLEDRKGLKARSASDVVSRTRRVEKLIDISLEVPYEQIIESLIKNEEYKNFSPYVKSQVKRAIKLYKEFVSEN